MLRYSVYTLKKGTINPKESNRGWAISQKPLSHTVTNYAWCPGIYKNNYRKKTNFLFADIIGLDFDGGVSLKEIENAFCDCKHILATTKSHQIAKDDQPPCDRFRLILVPSTRIKNMETYEYNVKKLIEQYDADGSCFDTARFFQPCKEIVSYNTHADAYTIDIEEQPDKPKPNYNDSPYKNTRVIPPWTRRELQKQHDVGTRYHYSWRIAKDLFRVGWNKPNIFQIISASPAASGLEALHLERAIKDAEKSVSQERNGA